MPEPSTKGKFPLTIYWTPNSPNGWQWPRKPRSGPPRIW